MTAPPRDPRSVRRSFSITPEALERLEKIKSASGGLSDSDIIRRALSLYSTVMNNGGSDDLLSPEGPIGREEVIRRGNGSGALFGHGGHLFRSDTNTNGTRKAPRKVTLSVSSVLIPEKLVPEGLLVRSTSLMWKDLLRTLNTDWTKAYQFTPYQWEEIIAGAFKAQGFDEVVLTPSSHDKGRDVIATKRGIGCVRILGSMKAYGPGRLVGHNEVRALVGVLQLEPNASKGMLITTADFAPGVKVDPAFAALQPTRLELLNYQAPQNWLKLLELMKG
jgi:restriction system protein